MAQIPPAITPIDFRRCNLYPAGQDHQPSPADPSYECLANKSMAGGLAAGADARTARVFGASDRATYITGSNLVVDGGWLAR